MDQEVVSRMELLVAKLHPEAEMFHHTEGNNSLYESYLCSKEQDY